MLMQPRYPIEDDKKEIFKKIDRVINKLIAIEQLEDKETEAKLAREIIETCQKITAEDKFLFRNRF